MLKLAAKSLVVLRAHSGPEVEVDYSAAASLAAMAEAEDGTAAAARRRAWPLRRRTGGREAEAELRGGPAEEPPKDSAKRNAGRSRPKPARSRGRRTGS